MVPSGRRVRGVRGQPVLPHPAVLSHGPHSLTVREPERTGMGGAGDVEAALGASQMGIR